MKEKTIAIKAAKEAGKVLLNNFEKNFEIKTKSKHEIVTKVDLLAEKKILNLIKKHFPEHNILSEEAGKIRNKSNYLWVVDPLDGTTNYSIGNPIFATTLALLYKNEIILGIIYAPFLKKMFIAEKGKGAYCNNKKIHVSNVSKIENSILTFCHGNTDKAIKSALKIYKKFKFIARDIRQLGAASIELAFVSSGKIESIIIPGNNVWDVVAGTLLVREAGGKVTDFKNQKWNIRSKDILASNIKIHKKILTIIKN